MDECGICLKQSWEAGFCEWCFYRQTEPRAMEEYSFHVSKRIKMDEILLIHHSESDHMNI